jgi:poly(3-hydroxybutyrate) depolymerase
MKAHYLQPTVGHYGVFNGSRFRAEIAPRIADFIATHGRRPANGAKTNGNGKARAGGQAARKPAGAAKGN